MDASGRVTHDTRTGRPPIVSERRSEAQLAGRHHGEGRCREQNPRRGPWLGVAAAAAVGVQTDLVHEVGFNQALQHADAGLGIHFQKALHLAH